MSNGDAVRFGADNHHYECSDGWVRVYKHVKDDNCMFMRNELYRSFPEVNVVSIRITDDQIHYSVVRWSDDCNLPTLQCFGSLDAATAVYRDTEKDVAVIEFNEIERKDH